jgi:oligogalacturonide lyase
MAMASDVGLRFPSEKTTFVDRVTGLPVTVLTRSGFDDHRIYQIHSQWMHDGRHIVFRSNRAANGQQMFAVDEVSGEIIQLTDDPGISTLDARISRKEGKLYFSRKRDDQTQLVVMDIAEVLAHRHTGKAGERSASDSERVIAVLPEGLRIAGGISLDADETKLYVGVDRLGEEPQVTAPEDQHWRIEQVPGGIRTLSLESGEWSTLVDVPFKVGHIQANPWVAGEVLYAHETGGDAVQRMWLVNGAGNRPLFEEQPLDWVTHEVFSGPDEVMFNLIGFQARLRVRPTGIAVINLRTNAVELLGQVTEKLHEGLPFTEGPGGYWHCNGSPDGRWAAGDTFRGDLWLIDRSTRQQRRLSTDHKMLPDHLHPSFSPDGSRILIQSGYFSEGKTLDLMIINLPGPLLADGSVQEI